MARFTNITDNTNRAQFKAAYVGDDSIDGTAGADRIRGWAGRDTIWGEGGNDEIRGDGVGLPYDPDLPDTDPVNFADSIRAGGGNDSVWGGGGADTLLGEDGNDRLYGQGGGDSIEGGRGADEIVGAEGNDRCSGGADNDWIVGGAGRDTLSGDAGDDKIYAFAPASEASRWGWVDAGEGDVISGGQGRDTLIGSAGIDIFDFNAATETGNSLTTCDVITDFEGGRDKIDLKDIDASTVLPGNNSFLWRGTGPFTTSKEGELRYQKYDNAGTANDYTVIFGDTDADTASEFQIKLQGLVTLTQSDFVLAPAGARVVFTAEDGTHGRELWRSDGTEAGTVLVKDINPGSGGNDSDNWYWGFYPGGPLTDVNGTLYFAANDGTRGGELWRSDGTEAGTVLVKDINPGSGGGDPGGLTNVNGTLYFSAEDGTNGRELWKSDGTAAGTVLVKDINPGSSSSLDYWGSSLTNVNGTLFFTANDGTSGNELWKSNGTAAGTVLVKDINPGSGGGDPGSLTNVNGTLFFIADDGTNGRELWKSDGTAAGTVLVKDINPGSGGSGPSGLTNVNGTLFFTADDGTSGRELWKSNGTAAGTVLVKDINPGSNGSDPGSLTNFKGALFFNADDNTNGGGDLWKSDGSAAGTVLVKDIDAVDPLGPDWDGGGVGGLTAVNGVLFFTRGRDAWKSWDHDLWKSDGTEAGTVPVTGNFGNATGGLTNVNGTLIFSAGHSGPSGPGALFAAMELWKSDGTEAGTVMVKDIWPGHPYDEGPNPADITPFDFVLV